MDLCVVPLNFCYLRGFNEDPDTGIVYTGVPGFGLCRISPDLKKWERIGSDERLKGNIHGIVVSDECVACSHLQRAVVLVFMMAAYDACQWPYAMPVMGCMNVR